MDSSILAGHGRREIGRRSVWMERGFETFGTGITSADFQIGGTYPSLMEALKIAASGWHKYGAKSRKSQLGRPSGPWALWIFIWTRRFSTSEGSTIKFLLYYYCIYYCIYSTLLYTFNLFKVWMNEWKSSTGITRHARRNAQNTWMCSANECQHKSHVKRPLQLQYNSLCRSYI